MRIAKKTILTKLRKMFELAVEAGDKPFCYCQKTLEEGLNIINGLEREHSASTESERFIRDFERKFTNNELDECDNTHS